MPKRLVFLYRYLTTPHRLRKWLNAQTVVVFLVTVAFVVALIWTAPVSTFGREGELAARLTASPGPSNGPTVTPLPPDFLTNSQQTIGITIAGAVLVLIVVVGVLVFLPRMDEGG